MVSGFLPVPDPTYCLLVMSEVRSPTFSWRIWFYGEAIWEVDLPEKNILSTKSNRLVLPVRGALWRRNLGFLNWTFARPLTSVFVNPDNAKELAELLVWPTTRGQLCELETSPTLHLFSRWRHSFLILVIFSCWTYNERVVLFTVNPKNSIWVWGG